jgi:hypothetical protein
MELIRMNFEGMTIKDWQHSFASDFFDEMVKYELQIFGERYMEESRLWEIAYDNAVISSETMSELNPAMCGRNAVASLIDENNRKG